jgi:hypothetical protein
MTETGGGARDNEQYAVDYGNSSTGDTYSYGSAGSAERALGCLQSGTLIPIIGAKFTNNTGRTITSIYIAYYGEQWRSGNTGAARDDRLDFQYSTNATDLTSGTWTDVNALDFTSIIKTTTTGTALNGNDAANKVSISSTINGLNIPAGATFWIRWSDFNAITFVDGQAIDDFSLQPDLNSFVTFTSGSDFTTPLPSPGTNDNVLGRMCLTGDLDDAFLTSLTINVSGDHSGVTGYKVWSSTDETFDSGSDELLAAAGDGAAVTFNSFSTAISTTGTYYFVTADLAAEASGEVTLTITNSSSFSIINGNLTTDVNNDQLSQSSTALPVELTYFTAKAEQEKVILNWQTATEVNNYGFEIERSLPPSPLPKEGGVTPLPLGKGLGDGQWKGLGDGQWEKIGFVQGNGNSNSPKEYSFVDNSPSSGNLQYRLKQIDTDGKYEYYSTIAEVYITITGIIKQQIPAEFALEQNFPNPFNPITKIMYQIPGDGHVLLRIYDTLGKEIITLVNAHKEAGRYSVEFNASNLPSGTYIYQLRVNDYTSIKKMILLK